ncbi:MAG: hypothetical protein WC414_02090 [Patescibacteria group bacterium]
MFEKKTRLTVEEISKLVYHNLEYKFQEKLSGPEKPKKERRKKIFYQKICEPIAHNLIKNDSSIPILDFKIFSKILEELGVFSILGIEEKMVANEMATIIFDEWYNNFFPEDPYRVFWNMVLSAECLAEKFNMKAIEVVAEMFPIKAPKI